MQPHKQTRDLKQSAKAILYISKGTSYPLSLEYPSRRRHGKFRRGLHDDGKINAEDFFTKARPNEAVTGVLAPGESSTALPRALERIPILSAENAT
jgi:hypothetical protein